MKILIGMPAKDSWGGPISSEPPFAQALQKLGQNVVEAVYVFGDKEKPTPIFERIRRVGKTAFQFRKLLKTQDFDIIHFNTAFDLKTILRDSFSLFVMRPGKSKVFFKLHGSEADKFANTNFLVRFLINYLIKNVDGFGVHTKEELANFKNLGFDESKFYFVKNAVTIHENLGVEFTRKQKESNDVFDLFFVSRFIPAKGLIETIDACKLLKEKGYKFRLFCVGDGETREEAENNVKKYNLQDQVFFTGYISEDEVTKHFFEQDIFVFPTRHAEGFPNVLFKAVAVGMPILTTRVRAANDYLTENINCVFSTQKPEEIADSLIELIKDKNLRTKMSKNNLELGKTLLPENIAKEFIEIYKDILENSPKSNI